MMNNSAKNHHLLREQLLIRNVGWNLIGNGAPMMVAIVTIPILIQELGKERFGMLALAWALIGYASLFDLGLGRALTQLVAKKLGAEDQRDLAVLLWTSLLLMLTLGVLGTAVIVLISPWLVHHALKVPVTLQKETLRSFYLLGASIPVVITTSGLRGLLEAHQRFRLINALRIPMGVFSFAGPLLALPFSKSLTPVVGILVLSRYLAFAAHAWACLRVAPELRRGIVWGAQALGPLLPFGGWMTVSNIISPLMVILDRFLIGALVSMAAVAYYATPYEVATKLLFIPTAVMGVMFPAFSTGFVLDRHQTAGLYRKCVKYLFLILFPAVLLITGLARNGLTLWLGRDFAQHSARVLQWLAAGVFLNCLAQVPFALVQGVGRPDLTARLHAIELPCYLLTLWWLISAHGIEGAAIAWTARAAFDCLCLLGMARRFLPGGALVTFRGASLLAVALITLTSVALPSRLHAKGIFLGVAIVVFVFAAWFLLFTPEERKLARGYL